MPYKHGLPYKGWLKPDNLSVSTYIVHKACQRYVSFGSDHTYSTDNQPAHALFLEAEHVFHKATGL